MMAFVFDFVITAAMVLIVFVLYLVISGIINTMFIMMKDDRD